MIEEVGEEGEGERKERGGRERGEGRGRGERGEGRLHFEINIKVY